MTAEVYSFWATVCKSSRPMLSDRCPVCPVPPVTLVYCGQTAEWIKMPLSTEIGLDPGDTVSDGDPALPKRGRTAALHFYAHVCCEQTVGWIRMPLSMEVGFGPGHIVLDGDPATPFTEGAQQPPHFSAHVYILRPNSRPSQKLLSSCINL